MPTRKIDPSARTVLRGLEGERKNADKSKQFLEQSAAIQEAVPEPVRNLLSAFLGRPLRECDPMPPEWAKQLGKRWGDMILPGISGWLQDDGPALNGQLFGAIKRVLLGIRDRSGKGASTPSVGLDWSEHILLLYPAIMADAEQMPPNQQVAFFTGFAKGMTIDVSWLEDAKRFMQIGSPRFVLYTALLALWPEVEELGETGRLYRMLTPPEGNLKLGDLDTFRRLCRRLGIYKGRRGRPKNRTPDSPTSS